MNYTCWGYPTPTQSVTRYVETGRPRGRATIEKITWLDKSVLTLSSSIVEIKRANTRNNFVLHRKMDYFKREALSIQITGC